MLQKIKFNLATKVLSVAVMLIPVTLIVTHRLVIKDDIILPDVIGVLLFAAFFITWMLHPTSYEITSDELLIHRPKGPIKIALSDIKTIEKTDAGLSIRLFGSGGLFGYFGYFSSKKLGKHYRYTGNNEDLVCITCSTKKYLLSIYDQAFLNHLIEKIK
ncbi:MAG: PH domain-containing protein [Bacteroidota bacterium]